MNTGKVHYQAGDGDLLLWWDGDGELNEDELFADIERNHGKGFASYLRAIWEHDKFHDLDTERATRAV